MFWGLGVLGVLGVFCGFGCFGCFGVFGVFGYLGVLSVWRFCGVWGLRLRGQGVKVKGFERGRYYT